MRELIEDFDRLLDAQFSADYWSDEGISAAAEIAQKFESDDWAMLTQLTNHRPVSWKARCADALGDEISIAARDILLVLMNDEDFDVRYSALDSLNSLAQLGMDLSVYREDIAAVLRHYVPTGSVVKFLIDSLKNRLSI
jgi:hypothetical protein